MTSPPKLRERHPNHEIARRWPYAVDVELNPSAYVKYVSSGPELATVGPSLQARIGHGVSQFEIGRTEFDRALHLLRLAQRRGNETEDGLAPDLANPGCLKRSPSLLRGSRSADAWGRPQGPVL